MNLATPGEITRAFAEKKDRRGPADKSSYVGSDTQTKNLPDNVRGVRPKAQNLGGVPAGPVSVSRAKRAPRPVAKDEEQGGGAGGAPCPVNVTWQNSSGPLITNPKIVLMWWSTYFWDVHKTQKNYYKAALNAFILCLREQLRDTSVKVIELSPPAVQTELHDVEMGVEAGRKLGMPLDAFTDLAYKGLCSGQDQVVIGTLLGQPEVHRHLRRRLPALPPRCPHALAAAEAAAPRQQPQGRVTRNR